MRLLLSSNVRNRCSLGNPSRRVIALSVRSMLSNWFYSREHTAGSAPEGMQEISNRNDARRAPRTAHLRDTQVFDGGQFVTCTQGPQQ